MARSARHVFVSGRVQGVAFRWRTLERAEALGVCGWVRNLPDGRVEARLEAEGAALESMLTWLKAGPSMSRVDALDVRERDVEGFESFEILR